MNTGKPTVFINKNKKLTLLCPPTLCSQYKINEKANKNIIEKIKIFQHYFQSENFNQEIGNLLAIVESYPMIENANQISAIELLNSEGKVKSVKQEEIEEFNNYFDIQYVLTEWPESILLDSAFTGYVTFLELTKNSAHKWTVYKLDTLVNPEFNPLLIWKKFHWIFLIFVQGLILCLLRF
ncbi:MAG: hypothetical protein F6K65_19845 [Moorea sp. SIO3C2]|nr:hypothetical protein [Moorena sp. SIO3C2]